MKQSLIIAMAFVLAQLAGAQEYKVTDLGPLTPVAINDFGIVAGNLNNHAYLWASGYGRYDLGVPAGATFSIATGINDLNSVAGTANGPGTVTYLSQTASCASLTQPFVWTPVKGFTSAPSIPLADLEEATVGAPASFCNQAYYATGLNLFDQMVFTSQEASTYVDGFLWKPGQPVTNLDQDYQDSVNAINDLGAIVGQITALTGGTPDTPSSSFLLEGGVETKLPALTADSDCSGPTSINDFGQVVGWSSVAPGMCNNGSSGTPAVHAFLWSAGDGISDLGTLPGDTSSMAVKISFTGSIVGNSGNAATFNPATPPYLEQVTGHAFLWTKPGGMRDLNGLISPHSGWVLNSAADINVLGQIVGTGTVNGQTHGYLLTPADL